MEVPGGYAVGTIKLYIDGVRQGKDDFIADNGTTVEFGQTLPSGTKYIVEQINQFAIPGASGSNVSIIDPQIFNIRYSSDLFSPTHVDHSAMTLNDLFNSRFYDGARQHGSGGQWQLVDMAATAPDGTNGLNSDGCIYYQEGLNYFKFSLVSTECSPLKYGKGSCLIKELLNVVGGFHGQPMILGGFWDIGDQGGGIFVWDSTKDKTEHDGGTVIDPGKISELSGSVVGPNYTTGDGTGVGCWVRVYTGATDPSWFGS